MDSDVKSELQAMIGAPKANPFGASRSQSKFMNFTHSFIWSIIC